MELIVITDLDNTLLSKYKYDFTPALPAIEELKRRGVPIIFCTSKTLGETVSFQEKIGIKDPFIVENGGGIYIPRVFYENFKGEKLDSEFFEIDLGVPAQILYDFLYSFSKKYKVPIKTFLDFQPEELAKETGLPLELAILAREREFDLPFILLKGSLGEKKKLQRMARKEKYLIQEGGRFLHISGRHTKADAIREMFDFMGDKFNKAKKIGLGDSLNDLEMLSFVDIPIVVSGTGNPYLNKLKKALPHAKIYMNEGPIAWNQAIFDLLESI